MFSSGSVLFKRINAQFLCEHCDDPIYITTVGSYVYSIRYLNRFFKEICSKCDRPLSVIRITAKLKKGDHD